jgi:hypothetical protein
MSYSGCAFFLKVTVIVAGVSVYVPVLTGYQTFRGVGRCICQTDINDVVDPTVKKLMSPWDWVWLNGKKSRSSQS